MLKTGFRAFIYSFSVSLFAIIGANKAFFSVNKPSDEALNIQNKTIALYLAKPSVIKAPTKKIALNTLSDIQKEPSQPLLNEKPEVILASNLEPMTIPLEFISDEQEEIAIDNASPSQEDDKIVLADVLYAPNMSLPEQKIEAEPIYTPENGIELKVVEEKVYSPDEKTVAEKKITPPPAPDSTSKEDNSLILARNEKPAIIPLMKSSSNQVVGKIHLGNPKDLQHVAYAGADAPIQSMTSENKSTEQPLSSDKKDWKPMDDSPWVVAKSTGSKNSFVAKDYANKSDKEIADILSEKPDKKGVKIASETAKNLIIPIPQEILDEKDISPQLAYPESSDDKQKEIDINEKIKKSESQKKAEEAKKEEKATPAPVLTPIEEDIDKKQPTDTAKIEDSKKAEEPKTPKKEAVQNPTPQGPGIMDTISSIFGKTSKNVSETKEKITKKLKERRARYKKRKKSDDSEVSIMPTEIRLSFQANKAEISGQTLRWIQAFASKTAQTPGMMLEIRIDGASSTKLQQQRLNLLYNILTNKGLDYSLINTVFTSRDPNSFILRTIMPKNNSNKKGVNNQKANRYIQW